MEVSSIDDSAVLSRDRVSHFEMFGKKADIAIDKIRTRNAEGYAVDFQDAVSRFTMDSATVRT